MSLLVWSWRGKAVLRRNNPQSRRELGGSALARVEVSAQDVRWSVKPLAAESLNPALQLTMCLSFLDCKAQMMDPGFLVWLW